MTCPSKQALHGRHRCVVPAAPAWTELSVEPQATAGRPSAAQQFVMTHSSAQSFQATQIRRSDAQCRARNSAGTLADIGPMLAQALRVYLLNEADLTFLHSLEVSEEDFTALKAEQGILVDFGSFPAKLVSLLEKCIASRVQDPPRRVALPPRGPLQSCAAYRWYGVKQLGPTDDYCI